MGWMLIASWFCASLLSQAMYMAINGVPYGPEILMDKMGSFYWAVVAAELMIWVGLGFLLVKRIIKPKIVEQSAAVESSA